MRILEIAPPWIKPWPPLSYGAIERVVWELGEALRRAGVDVDYAVEYDEIQKAALGGGYDFIHCHTPEQGRHIRELGLTYLATSHWSQHWNDTPEGAIAREFVERAAGHLALCERVRDGRRCAVIGQGVDLAEFPSRKDKDARDREDILMVGTYQYAHSPTTNPVERKRYRHGVKALSLMPAATLTIAGPGEAQMIWDICRDEGVDPGRVALPGNLERGALISLMQSSTVLLHAATQEVVALVPLEAMAAGLPVICARPADEYGMVMVYDHWEHIPAIIGEIKSHYTRQINKGLRYAASQGWDAIASKTLTVLNQWLEVSEREMA